MNTTQLGYFLTLAATRNYTTAAEQLYVTQPTLSRNIMALESEVGTALFSRTGGGVALTAAGEVFYQGIAPMSRQYEALLRQVKAAGQGMAGELILAISGEQQMLPCLLSAIRAFREAYPSAVFTFQRLNSEQLRSGLMDGTIDLALTIGVPPHVENPLEELLLATEQPCVVTPLRDGAASTISAEECAALLTEHGVVLPNPRPNEPVTETALDSLREMLNMPALTPRVLFADDISAVSLYIAAGMGATLCNESHSLALQPGVTMQKIRDAEILYRKVLQYRPTNRNPVLKTFLDFLKEKGVML